MKLRLIFSFLIVFSTISYGQNQKLRAYVDNKQFYAPGVGNYVEFNFQFTGYSINYVAHEEGLIGELLVESSITDGEKIVASNAYRLASPIMRDSIVDDFYDVQRFLLEPGDYEFRVRLHDLNSENEPLTASMPIRVEDLGDAIAISDISIAEYATEGDPNSMFFKSGYDIIPRLSTFYPEQLNTLPVYFEVYNATMLGDSSFSIQQTLIDAKSGEVIESFSNVRKYTTEEVVPVFRKIMLDDLITGTYALRYTILNEKNTPLASRFYEFERSNELDVTIDAVEIVLDPAFQASVPEDSLGYYLESLIPISKANDVRILLDVLKAKDAELARKHFQKYWIATAGTEAYSAWISYKAQVQLVQQIYGNNFQEGFETDRGRVYLQYGSPTNIISREVSDTEYPYEIWQYNKIGSFSNKRFVFYNPDLVNNTYQLLHSDMIGELKNNAWPQILSKRNTKNGGVDDPNSNVIDKWGQNSQDDFRQY